ncbi:hypothetical protein SMACR_07446 [Sordaria macrospora]|uniref:WGS project CABT00000000 data, contig 2.1 n=2 Tax=Sordaria macrospora TaxID=5147 RepID=F7VM15_SORMK|nr:uncharacterized protein SMAC_07446 [Sordaria macrospora k-hell]KAA8630500.1 hypothetical protein SMACR_07446 [Sordaria macrospora]KAH7628320.1 hypothetical protein B0T09DRAFT_346410 [Sordaria sp. MPI-SDFR-AT-0083]WPJ65766.1 hypothetical protein SMAC4_07446 [Sordaria macrospora]CCC06543.1 unnamed protein product [Sordaria macrospora k-hell]
MTPELPLALQEISTSNTSVTTTIHTRQDSNMFLSTRTSSLAQRGRPLLRNTYTGPVPGIPRSSRHGYATDKKRAGKSGNFKATGEQPAQPGQPKRVDPNSPEYKAYQRTWTTVMIGTPIILVCSYELWQRLIDGKKPLSLEPKDKIALTDLTPHSESPSTTS